MTKKKVATILGLVIKTNLVKIKKSFLNWQRKCPVKAMFLMNFIKVYQKQQGRDLENKFKFLFQSYFWATSTCCLRGYTIVGDKNSFSLRQELFFFINWQLKNLIKKLNSLIIGYVIYCELSVKVVFRRVYSKSPVIKIL